MDFYLHAITGKRLTSTQYPTATTDTPSGKLQSTEQVRIQYSLPDPAGGSSNIPCAAPNPVIKFGLKQTNHYSDTTFDAYTDTFTAPVDPTLPTAFYTANLDIDSVALRALFPVATDGTSQPQVSLMGEILSGGVPSDTFTFLAINNVIKGPESPAVAVPGPSGYPLPTQVLTPGKEDVYTFTYGGDIGGDFQVLGANACLVAGELGLDTISGDPSVTGGLVVIIGARGLTSLTCTGAGVTSLGTLPAGLIFLCVEQNSLSASEQDSILAQLVANGLSNGEVYLDTQEGGLAPTAAGVANVLILQARGWIVSYD